MEGPDVRPIAQPRTRYPIAWLLLLAATVLALTHFGNSLVPSLRGLPRDEAVTLAADFVVPGRFAEAVRALEQLAGTAAKPLIGTDSVGDSLLRATILRLMGTNGWNYDIGPDSIVAWLRALERDQPFVLTGIGFDWLEGRFTDAIRDAGALARRFRAFCPDLVEQGTETVAARRAHVTAPVYSIADDDGLLALIDPDAYESFIARQWTNVERAGTPRHVRCGRIRGSDGADHRHELDHGGDVSRHRARSGCRRPGSMDSHPVGGHVTR